MQRGSVLFSFLFSFLLSFWSDPVRKTTQNAAIFGVADGLLPGAARAGLLNFMQCCEYALL